MSVLNCTSSVDSILVERELATIDFPSYLRDTRDRPTYVILGVQGSGTNLAAKILRRAFGISVVRDRSLILSVAKSLVGQISARRVQQAHRRIATCLFPDPFTKRLLTRQWHHQAREFVGIDKFIEGTLFDSPTDFAAFYYGYHAFRGGCVDRGLKSDDCWMHLDSISDVLPNRRTILVVRDPRDNANSIMHKDFGPCTALGASRFVQHQLRLYLDHARQQGERAIVVKYEDLLANPMDSVRRISEQLGIAPIADLSNAISNIDIRTSNVQKWRHWSTKDLMMSESVLFTCMQELGYSPVHSTPTEVPSSTLMTEFCADMLKRVPQRLRSTWQHKVLAK